MTIGRLALAFFTVASLLGCPGPAPTAPAEHPGVGELGLTARIDRAADPTAPACVRLENRADHLRRKLLDAELAQPGLKTRFKQVVAQAIESFGSNDRLALGEVHRSYQFAVADGQVSPAELQLLVAALDFHARRGGAHFSLLDRVPEAADDVSIAPEVRNRIAVLVLDIADLAASLHECAPLAGGSR